MEFCYNKVVEWIFLFFVESTSKNEQSHYVRKGSKNWL